MITPPNPNQSSAQVAVGALLQALLPGIEIIEAQDNRVPEPAGLDFIIITPIDHVRLSTNVIGYADVAFTGVAAGTNLTVSGVRFGSIASNATLWGVNVAAGTQIVTQQSGPVSGGAGIYLLSQALSLTAQPMAAGNLILTQPTRVHLQLDFHSASVGDAADMATIISAFFRSEIASDAFIGAMTPGVSPLYADDPRQMPFINAEQQVESRWVMDAFVQCNFAIPWPLQFSDGVPAITFEQVK